MPGVETKMLNKFSTSFDVMTLKDCCANGSLMGKWGVH